MTKIQQAFEKWWQEELINFGAKTDEETSYHLFKAGYEAREAKPCVWKYDVWDDFYNTGCGRGYTTLDGTLKDNSTRFCPFCGGLIKEEKE